MISHRRRGHLLAEALCALALSGVLAAAAALSLGAARRAMASTDRLASAERSSREAVSIIAALMKDADSVVVEGDTAAALSVTIGVGAVCARSGNAIMLPPMDVSAGGPIAARAQPIEAGDLISILMVDSLAIGAYWVHTLVDSVSERTMSSPCGATEGWATPADAGATRLRLVLRDTPSADMPIGAPVRLLRRGRLSLYHAGRGDWMLGWRRCAADGSGCGAIQPVAGPLRTPGAGGLRLRVDVAAGTILIAASGLPPARPAHLTIRPRDGG